MLIHNLLDNQDGSRCILTYDESNDWLRATWCGYVNPAEATRGAETYLAKVQDFPCAFLLNDNTELQGPWFDSVDWLGRVWLPHAQRLGLRYLAHVVQADTHVDILTAPPAYPLAHSLDLQLFHVVAEAEEWLRSCQQTHKQGVVNRKNP